VSAIVYGDKANPINETWTFNIIADSIEFNISRTISKSVTAEKVSLPVFTFKSMDTWEGAYTDYGGLAWFYLFNKKLDTYGVHSSTTQFWNSKTGNGLTVAVDVPGKQVAMSYSRTTADKLEYTIAVAEHEMLPRLIPVRTGDDLYVTQQMYGHLLELVPAQQVSALPSRTLITRKNLTAEI
jgi:hypothetical protein